MLVAIFVASTVTTTAIAAAGNKKEHQSNFTQYLPATISGVWDEGFLLKQSAPAGEI